MNDTKCDAHSKEITEIRTEFNEYKKNTNMRLDEIIEKLKPQFTASQITTFLMTFVISMASAMIYITDVKSDARDNNTRILNLEREENINKTRYENIDLKLEKLLTSVAVLESKNKNNGTNN